MTLIGHNGAGKSTLIHYLLGFYTSTKQHPFLEHFSSMVKPLDRTNIGYAPEAALLDSSMSAENYFRMMGTLRDVQEFDAQKLLDKVSLQIDLNAPIKSFSKGMKQRLLLAIALLGDPYTLVLDEPTSGLDPFGKEAIESLIEQINQQHELILCTHSLDFAYRLGNEIWILHEGQIVYQGIPASLEALEELYNKYRPTRLL